MNIRHFTQPDKCGCVIACIAMVTCKDGDNVSDHYRKISGDYIAHDLNRQGYNTKCQNKILNDKGYSTNTIPYLSTKPHTTCILTVDSLNHKDSWHALVFITGPDARVLDPNDGYVPKSGEKPHAVYTLKMIRDISNNPNKFHDCTEITKGGIVSNTGVTKSEKKYDNVVKKWVNKDCKDCTGDMEVVPGREHMVSLYGGSDSHNDELW